MPPPPPSSSRLQPTRGPGSRHNMRSSLGSLSQPAARFDGLTISFRRPTLPPPPPDSNSGNRSRSLLPARRQPRRSMEPRRNMAIDNPPSLFNRYPSTVATTGERIWSRRSLTPAPLTPKIRRYYNFIDHDRPPPPSQREMIAPRYDDGDDERQDREVAVSSKLPTSELFP